MQDKDRFEVRDAGGPFFGPSTSILVDKKTGVNYLVVTTGSGCGVTPLLNRDGTPIITAISPASL